MSWVFFLFFVSSFLVTFCVMSGLLYSLPKYYICFHYDPSNQPTRITTNKQIKKSYFIILIFKNKTIQYFFLMSDWIFIKGMFFSLSTLHRFFCSQVGSWFFTYKNNNAEKICVCSLFSFVSWKIWIWVQFTVRQFFMMIAKLQLQFYTCVSFPLTPNHIHMCCKTVVETLGTKEFFLLILRFMFYKSLEPFITK